jgi:ribonuclease P protein component
MGKRDDRLHGPEAFQQALMTRPIARDGVFVIYKIPCPGGAKIGFVLPKKLVRTAVHRNQIKRWARDIFRKPRHSSADGFGFVLRVKASLSKTAWDMTGKKQIKQSLVQVMKKALENQP